MDGGDFDYIWGGRRGLLYIRCSGINWRSVAGSPGAVGSAGRVGSAGAAGSPGAVGSALAGGESDELSQGKGFVHGCCYWKRHQVTIYTVTGKEKKKHANKNLMNGPTIKIKINAMHKIK